MGAERDRVAGFGRLEDGLRQAGEWYRWGPYVSERQWGTVREDYSADGEAWDYLPHDQARSRAYRWGEDGLAGFCDVEQRLCLGLALWNGKDPILKERAFGLTGAQGNHGEDVKDYWWYLDAVPSHAWNRWRYHYPQDAFPYQDLVDQNGARSREEPEYELLDTGVFDDDRYWITEVHYAKASADDLLMAVRVTNSGPEAATLHVLPTAWFRNTWSWDAGAPRPACGRRASRRWVSTTRFSDRWSWSPDRPGRLAAGSGVLRERDEYREAVRLRAGHALPEGWHQRSCHRRRGHRQSRSHGHQGRVLVPAHACSLALRPSCGCGCPRQRRRPPRRGRGSRSWRGLRHGDGGAASRSRRVLRRADARRRRAATRPW